MPPTLFGLPTLPVLTAACWVVGIVLIFISILMKPKTEGVVTEKTVWLQAIEAIVGGLVSAIKKITSPSGTWEFIQGVGSLLMWVGLGFLIAWLVILLYDGAIKPLLRGDASPPTPSATPAA